MGKCKGRSGGRWEGNIKTDLTEIGWECVNWLNVAKVGTVGWLL